MLVTVPLECGKISKPSWQKTEVSFRLKTPERRGPESANRTPKKSRPGGECNGRAQVVRETAFAIDNLLTAQPQACGNLSWWSFASDVEQTLAKKRTQPVIFRSYFKSRPLHLRRSIPASNRLPFRWNLKSSAALQQHYRRSRVHLSLRIDQDATEMEKCDEEILLGYGWSSGVGHGRSCVSR
jgi:hypothetical protein